MRRNARDNNDGILRVFYSWNSSFTKGPMGHGKTFKIQDILIGQLPSYLSFFFSYPIRCDLVSDTANRFKHSTKVPGQSDWPIGELPPTKESITQTVTSLKTRSRHKGCITVNRKGITTCINWQCEEYRTVEHFIIKYNLKELDITSISTPHGEITTVDKRGKTKARQAGV